MTILIYWYFFDILFIDFQYFTYWYIDIWPVRSSFHRYCPASPQNSHLQLSGIFFWEPRFPKNQKWKIFSWSGSIASNLIIYKISKEIPLTLASNQNASAKKSLPSSDAEPELFTCWISISSPMQGSSWESMSCSLLPTYTSCL